MRARARVTAASKKVRARVLPAVTVTGFCRHTFAMNVYVTQKDRRIVRQTDRQTDRQTGRQAGRQTDGQTDGQQQTHSQKHRQRD